MEQNPLVLVVEPNADYRDVLCTFLERRGFAALAPAVEDVLEVARTRSPVAIIGEHPVALPDGRPVCAVLAEDPRTRDIPFVAVTGRAMPDELVDANRSHRSGVFVKPVDHDLMLDRLETLLSEPAPEG